MIILLLLCLLVSLIFSGIAGLLAWNALKKNFELQDKQKDFRRFHTLMLDMLEEDTQFMKTEIIKRITLEIPETRAINSGILRFQNNLQGIRATLKEAKMLED